MGGGGGYRHPIGDSLVLLSLKPQGGSHSQSSAICVLVVFASRVFGGRFPI